MINTRNRLWIGLLIIYGITVTLLPVVHAENKEITGNKIVLKNKVSKDLKILKIRLTWKLVPDAVMYDLVITKRKEINPSEIVFVQHKIYTNGCELDTSALRVKEDDLYWQVQALDINGKTIAKITKPKPLIDVEINTTSPLTTTEFDKMDYAPLYPVYAWIPYLNASEYEVQVFYDKDDNPFTPDTLLNTYFLKDDDRTYYDDFAYRDEGTYWWRVRAKNKKDASFSNWSTRTYFYVTHKNIQVAAFGDSITQGGGAVSTPPSYIMYDWETYAGLPVLNLGFSGDTIEAMNRRFEADVLPFKPKILVIMGGVNNIREGSSAKQVIDGLEMLRAKCQSHQILPIFLTVTPINPDAMKKVYGLIATYSWKDEQIKINAWIMNQPNYVDVATPLTDTCGWLSPKLTTDGLHPDKIGKETIGKMVGTYIKEKTRTLR
jgi:lysophospholipase L1-like esterase